MFKHIIAAVDGSDHASRAVTTASSLAELCGARLTLIHVVGAHASARLPRHLRDFDAIEHASKTQEDVLQDAANELLQDAKSLVEGKTIQLQTKVAFGNPAKLIVDHASTTHADLIVMGSRGLSELRGLLIGSVSHQVTQLAECGVLIVK